MAERPSESLPALLGQALRLGAEHLRQTLALAQIETTGNIRAILGLVTLLGTAVLLVIVSFFLVLAAVVKGLAVLVGSEPLAAVIVAGPFLLASLVLLWLGLRRMALDNLEPRRTERQLAADARVVLGTDAPR
ncbi:hypothetical protein ASG40_00170 [Methylobacterium sp. Leaf399]|uniref:phage holin family protein n=1 Tax=Methylobacterium sp. Leaf399 TaxID=1736364 RepID=UPI0006F6EB57|nr:phage holin family protein [Methylobacterium sp. Leaf399]KQT19318.1 hypothetical protein ASG40_00170 [Methylobacterium sp. Leaf399]